MVFSRIILRQKEKEEKKASGINPEVTPLDTALEENLLNEKGSVLKTLKLSIRKQKKTKNWHDPFDKILQKPLLKQGQENWTETKRIHGQVQEKNPEVL